MLKNRKLKIFFALITISAFFLPYLQSYAATDPITDWGERKILGTILFFVLTVVVRLVIALQQMLDSSLRMGLLDAQGQTFEVVTRSWEIMRNFANMFFIIGLIVMAFATIFNVSGYNLKSLIARFLIAALLINFSLVIGTTIIDWTQSLSNVFLGSIGGFGNRLGQQLGAEKLLGASSDSSNLITDTFILGPVTAVSKLASKVMWNAITIDNKGWETLYSMFFNIVMGSVAVFALGVGFIMSIIRIPILMALLVVAPLAWVSSIFPKTIEFNRKWWNYFLGWNLFLPIYLFFIYFGLFFLNEQDKIFIAPNTFGTVTGGIGWTFEQIFGYLMVAVFLIGGAKFAMKGSRVAGAGGVAAGVWARGKAATRASTIGLAGAGAGYAWRSSGIPGAYKEAKEHITREGFAGTPLEKIPIIGGYRGQRGLEDRQAKIAGALGIPGIAEKQLSRNVEAAAKNLKDKRVHLDKNALLNIISTGSPEEKIAAAQLFTEENYGSLGPEEFTAVRKAFGKNMTTALGASTFRKMKLNEMSTDDLNQLLDPTNSNYISPTDDPTGNLSLLVYNALIDKRRIKSDQFQKALNMPGMGGARRATMITKAREIIGEDMSAKDRDQLTEMLLGMEKDSSGAFRYSAAEQANIQKENRDAIREVLKIRAQKKDSFFNDTSGNPVQSMLNNYTQTYFESPSEKKKFLEDVSRKHAYSAAMVLLDQGLVKDDAGQDIKRTGYIDPVTGNVLTSGEVEKLVTKQTFQKLSLEEKQTQSKAQWNSSTLSEVASEDMSRNSSSMQSWVSHDKYPTFNANTGGKIERESRRIIFHREFFGPFMDQARKLKTEISKLQSGQSTVPPALTPSQLATVKKALQDNNLGRLRALRGDYEKMCTRYNMVDATVITQFNRMDNIINVFRDRVIKLK